MEIKAQSEELVVRAKQGDQEAFGRIFDLFSDKIFRYISYKVKDRRMAEDILQDVFLKAWVGMKTLRVDEDLNFSAWLYKVASNTVNDFFRKKYRRPDTVELHEDISIDVTIVDEYMKYEGAETVRQAFKDLPPQYKQVLELRFIQGFPIEEVAQIMGKTNLAVRLVQHRALKKLKDILEDKYAFQF